MNERALICAAISKLRELIARALAILCLAKLGLDLAKLLDYRPDAVRQCRLMPRAVAGFGWRIKQAGERLSIRRQGFEKRIELSLLPQVSQSRPLRKIGLQHSGDRQQASRVPSLPQSQ